MALLATSALANISNTTLLENLHAICEALEPRPSKAASIGSCTNIKVVTYWSRGAPTFKFRCYQIIFISRFIKRNKVLACMTSRSKLVYQDCLQDLQVCESLQTLSNCTKYFSSLQILEKKEAFSRVLCVATSLLQDMHRMDSESSINERKFPKSP
jgi:hypothetical protein